MPGGQELDLTWLLRSASPSTRREFPRRAALAGLLVPAMGAVAAAHPVRTPRQDSETRSTFTTLGHQTVTSLSPDDASPTVFYVLTATIDAVHEDYADPLRVTRLCRRCHYQWSRARRREQGGQP